MNKEPTNKDILKAVNTLSEDNKSIKESVNTLSEEKNEILEAINTLSSANDKRFNKIESEVTSIKSTMVTKDYLDEKMADLRGDLVVLVRKEDVKVKKLVDILKNRKLISENEVKEIMAMEPFPQLAL